jgi:UDP-3-O-[3-hydroxymyristoyl] glucosamine N-acyltransferase
MARKINTIELAKMLNGRIVGNLDNKYIIDGTCPIDNHVEGKVSFIKKPKYVEMLAKLKGAIVVAPESLIEFCQKYPQNTYVVVDNVATSIMQIQEFFYRDQSAIAEEGISNTAKVDSTARVGRGTYVGENVFIGKGVVIGEKTKILHNSCILDNVIIGGDTYIYPGVCIYKNCQVGNNCLIHSGVRIGPDGFRFEQDIQSKKVHKMYHVGKVTIGNNVEIGANTAIDRATFEGEATTISDEVKIDNLVHVGHNARIGARTLIAALSCIGGSDVIGEDVWIGIGATISNGVHVGDRAKVLLNAVVAYDVGEDEIVSGFYAMPHRRWKQVWRNLKEGR